MQYDVTIVIINYNTKELTCSCIKSVIEHTANIKYKIIVVDNASTDGSVDMIQKKFPEVHLIQNMSNIGFGRANNIAINESDSKYIFLLNPDTLVSSNAVKEFYDFMEKPENKNVWCCGGNLIDRNGKNDISYSNFPTLTQVVFEFGLHKLFSKFYYSKLAVGKSLKGNNLEPFAVPVISGADMFIRSEALLNIGLFDNDFFLYYEETELSWRAMKLGYISFLIPKVNILHIGGQSTASLSLKKIEIFETSKLLFFRKCYGKYYAYLIKYLYLLWNIARYLLKKEIVYKQTAKIIKDIKI